MSGKTHGFVVNAFHQATIPRHDPSAVIDQIITKASVQMPFGHCHAHSHRQALPQWTRGAFNAVDQKIFRMPGTWTAQLTEIADIVDGRACIAS